MTTQMSVGDRVMARADRERRLKRNMGWIRHKIVVIS